MGTRKDELIKELQLIREEEQQKLSDEVYPMVKHFEGKYFKIKEDGFIIYIKVVNILKDEIFNAINDKIITPFAGIAIERYLVDNISFTFNYHGYVNELTEESEITEEEFNDVWKNSIEYISKKLEK